MEYKHTPGPWRASAAGTGYSIHEDKGADGLEVATAWAIDPVEERANARLMAAAPELLEALEEARGFIILHSAHDLDGKTNLVYRKVQAALAKAEKGM